MPRGTAVSASGTEQLHKWVVWAPCGFDLPDHEVVSGGRSLVSWPQASICASPRLGQCTEVPDTWQAATACHSKHFAIAGSVQQPWWHTGATAAQPPRFDTTAS